MSVRIDLVSVGTKLISDGSLDCIRPGSIVEVQRDEAKSELWVPCDGGRHYLSGQFNPDTWTYVGFDLYIPT